MAELVTFNDLSGEDQNFVINHSIEENFEFWDGIHGRIANYYKNPKNVIPTNRFNKEELQKLITDPKFRWLDVSSIGF